MSTFFNEPYAEASYLAAEKTIYCTWKKSLTADQYKHVFTAVLKKFEETGAFTYLSDIRNQGIVGTESRKWLESHIIPPAVKAGLRNIFVITSEDAFKMFYLNKVKSEVEKQKTMINTEYFTAEETALDRARKVSKTVAVA